MFQKIPKNNNGNGNAIIRTIFPVSPMAIVKSKLQFYYKIALNNLSRNMIASKLVNILFHNVSLYT